MKQRRLGPDGPMVGAVGLGGMYMSITGRPEQDQSIRAIHAANWRFSGYVADQFDSCGVKTRLHRHWLVLFGVQNRLQLHIVFECLSASFVNGANSGSKLRMGWI